MAVYRVQTKALPSGAPIKLEGTYSREEWEQAKAEGRDTRLRLINDTGAPVPLPCQSWSP